VAILKSALCNPGRTAAGSELSLYNSISQAVKRYPEFVKAGRGQVKLKG